MRLGTIAERGGGKWRAAAFIDDQHAVDLSLAAADLVRRGAAIDAVAADLFTTAVANGGWLVDPCLRLAREICRADRRDIAGCIHQRANIRIGPPVPEPRTFIAAGRNYLDHLREGQELWAKRGVEVQQASFPTGFVKLASSIVADGDDVVIPSGVDNIDYEIELVVVIGSAAHNVTAARALEHVAGYTICNDLSARRIQREEMQHQIGITLAKNFATFAPLGPWMTTSDEIPDPQSLDIRTTVNGETRQHANTKDMIFGVAELVAYWSRVGLRPGDMITTGTPAGVAVARPDPDPFYLRDGDVMELSIERIGTLRNTVRSGS